LTSSDVPNRCSLDYVQPFHKFLSFDQQFESNPVNRNIQTLGKHNLIGGVNIKREGLLCTKSKMCYRCTTGRPLPARPQCRRSEEWRSPALRSTAGCSLHYRPDKDLNLTSSNTTLEQSCRNTGTMADIVRDRRRERRPTCKKMLYPRPGLP